MNKSISLNQTPAVRKEGNSVKRFLKNISPFNNKSDAPAALLVVKKLLAFYFCYWTGLIVAEAIVIGGFFACGKNFLRGEMFGDDVMTLVKLYGMVVLIAVSVLYWKLAEKRKLSEMGVTKNISGWFIGAGAGSLLIIASISAIMIAGGVTFDGFSTAVDITTLTLMFGGYVVQGAAEEFLSRGLVLRSLKDKVSLPVAVGASALAFALPHMSTLLEADPRFAVSGTLILVLISCAFAFITLRTESIWAACGLHTIWNFSLECICGLTVSGSEGSSASIANMRANGETLVNGGAYGVEASAITAVIVGAAAALLWYSYKNNVKERQA